MAPQKTFAEAKLKTLRDHEFLQVCCTGGAIYKTIGPVVSLVKLSEGSVGTRLKWMLKAIMLYANLQ